MSDRIGKIMDYHFRISGGTGSKIKEHPIGFVGDDPLKLFGSRIHFGSKINPVFFRTVDNDFCLQFITLFLRFINAVGRGACGADCGSNGSGFNAVDNIFGGQKIGGGNCDCDYFV